MGLIHWWPFVKNGVDNGCVPLSNFSSISTTSGGKLGNCYHTTSNVYISDGATYFNYSNNSVSFAGWFKFNKAEIQGVINGMTIDSTYTTPTGNLLGNNSYGGLGLVWTANNIYGSGSFTNLYVGAYLRNSDQNLYVYGGDEDIVFDTWYHFAVVLDITNRKLNFYVNGVLKNSASYNVDVQYIANWWYLNVGYVWGGNGPTASIPFYCNDIRMYDHALSQKEVKEISKGLVLHYNFEDPYAEGTTNLITGITAGGQTSVSNGIVTTSGTNADTYFNLIMSESLTQGTVYTISCEAGGFTGSEVWKWPIGGQGNTSLVFLITKNGHNSFTFTMNDFDAGTNQCFMNDIYCTARETGNKYKFWNWQIEKKDHATPYVNGTRQPGIVYDNSGYGYNATPINNPQLVNDSSCGQYSVRLLDNANGYYKLNQAGALNMITNGTVSFWAKFPDNNYKMLFGTDDSGGLYYLAWYDGTSWYSNIGGSQGTAYCDGIRRNSPIIDNNWHLYTFVGVDFSGWGSSNYYYLCRYAGSESNSFQFHGYLADLKVYATALSIEDIFLEYNRKASIDKTGKLFTQYIKEYETTNNLIEKTTFNIENGTNFRTWSYLGACTEATYNANWPNDTDISLSAYVKSNCQVTQTSQGIRIYSEANATSDATWGGLVFSPMVYSRCLIKGHHYRISWHVKGHSSRQMTDVYWTNNVGWGQYPDADPTVHKTCLPPANFDGEMDCFYDFTIEDDVFKMTTSDVHSGFEPNTSYLAYASFKIGFTYQETGSMGTDIYITNLKMYDLTTGEVYKIEKNGIVKTTEVVSGRRDSARLHSDGVIDITNIEEC